MSALANSGHSQIRSLRPPQRIRQGSDEWLNPVNRLQPTGQEQAIPRPSNKDERSMLAWIERLTLLVRYRHNLQRSSTKKPRARCRKTRAMSYAKGHQSTIQGSKACPYLDGS
jgi:hypothetical protein